MGPLGFEPRTDGLKVSGSSFKTARKTHETAGLSRKQQGQTQVSGHLSDTKYDKYDAYEGWKRRSQAKRAHMCECCRRLLVEARLGPVPGRTPGLMPPATPPPSSSASSSRNEVWTP